MLREMFERLATEVAGLVGETKTEAIRKALLERRIRLRRQAAGAEGTERVQRFLEREVWARVPPDQVGRMPDRDERKEILGYGSQSS